MSIYMKWTLSWTLDKGLDGHSDEDSNERSHSEDHKVSKVEILPSNFLKNFALFNLENAMK